MTKFVKITIEMDDGETALTNSLTWYDENGKFPGIVRTLIGFIDFYGYDDVLELILKEKKDEKRKA